MNQNSANDQPVAELVQQLSTQTAMLVRKELELAKLELQEKGKRAGIGAGLFGGAGGVALYGVGVLVPPRRCCWPPRSSPGSPR